MRFWFDTEFYEDGSTIELISIGVVSEDGRTYYAETPESRRLARSTQWLATNVAPHLTIDSRHIYERWGIASALIEFMGEKPEIWAYYADYDWVALCQLFGTMMDIPKGWPKYCRDVKQWSDALGNPTLPEQTTKEHNALMDAQWTKVAWEFLRSLDG
jgi:hypothetical protein